MLSLEDHLRCVWITLGLRLLLGPSLRNCLIRNSLISKKCERLSKIWQIKFAERTRISLINPLSWISTVTLALIWLWSIYQVSLVFQSLARSRTSKKLPKECAESIAVTLWLLFFACCLLMQIWPRQTDCKWRSNSTLKAQGLSVSLRRLISWIMVPTQRTCSRVRMYHSCTVTLVSRIEASRTSLIRSVSMKRKRKNELTSPRTRFMLEWTSRYSVSVIWWTSVLVFYSSTSSDLCPWL